VSLFQAAQRIYGSRYASVVSEYKLILRGAMAKHETPSVVKALHQVLRHAETELVSGLHPGCIILLTAAAVELCKEVAGRNGQ
jgi:hypothetical protein